MQRGIRRHSLVYVNSADWCVTVKLTKLRSITNIASGAAKAEKGAAAFGGGIPVPDPIASAYGWTTAVERGDRSRALAPQDADADDRRAHADGGRDRADRRLDGNLLALDANSGKQLYSYDTKNAIAGGIITYSSGGKQYVAAAAGNTSFVAWRVTGKPTLFIFGM